MPLNEAETNVLHLSEGTIFKTPLCVIKLTPAQVTLQEQLIFALIRPVAGYMKHAGFKNNISQMDELTISIVKKVREYSEFLNCLGSDMPYCQQLLLENTIMVLEKEYEAPQYLLNKLQEWV